MIPYQLTSTVISLGIAGLILYFVRRSRLHGPFALWWMGVAAGVMLLGFFPGLIDRMAVLLGVGYPPVLALVLGLGVILIKVLTMELHLSRQEQIIRRLTQRLAILESQVGVSGPGEAGMSDPAVPDARPGCSR